MTIGIAPLLSNAAGHEQVFDKICLVLRFVQSCIRSDLKHETGPVNDTSKTQNCGACKAQAKLSVNDSSGIVILHRDHA